MLIFSGQEKFHALGPIYYRQSNGALLVYDITDEDSFVKVKNWVKELKKILGGEIIIVIVGNKTDLEKDRNVPTELAESYAIRCDEDSLWTRVMKLRKQPKRIPVDDAVHDIFRN